jgi:hypothetical protein
MDGRNVARHGRPAWWFDGRSLHHDPLIPQPDWLTRSASAGPDALAGEAIDRLRALLAAGDHSRAIAAELLAIDAAVTIACEQAAERWTAGDEAPESLLAWCEALARRIAATAE